MVRVFVLTALVSTFAMFGALGSKDTTTTLTCIAIACAACALGIRRISVLYRRRNDRIEGQRMFTEYLRRRQV